MESTSTARGAVQSEVSSLPRQAEVLVVGLVRNCAASLRADVARIGTALQGFDTVHWLLIESDSSDDSVAQLRQLEGDVEHFRFTSLGPLQATLPLRTERIAACRNEYLRQLRDDARYRNVQYVVMADMDGVNRLLDAAGIRSCWQRADWDVCTANQRGRYYDVWALRHPTWSPNDCWEQHRFLSRYNGFTELVLYTTVHSRMVHIPADSDWIEVDSAFGGFAIYRRQVLDGVAYVGVGAHGQLVCEHVTLHEQIRRRGYRIFVNPALINTDSLEHTKELRWGRRIDRMIKNLLSRLR